MSDRAINPTNHQYVDAYILDVKSAKGIANKFAGCDKVFVCSTEVVDSDGEIIRQDGWDLDRFLKNPVMLASHKHSTPDGLPAVLGSWKFVEILDNVIDKNGKPIGKALVAGAEFSKSSQLAREVAGMVEEGHIKAVSVGFMPKEGGYETIGGKKRYVHTKMELYEISIVAVPANPEALAKSRGDTGKPPGGEELKAWVKEAVAEIDQKWATTLNAKFEELESHADERHAEMISLLPDGINERGSDPVDTQNLIDDRGRSDGDFDPEESAKSDADIAKQAIDIVNALRK